ncbi:MAG: Rieske 2Fe-2S domain-containing protein [Gemmatimonadaceae bacterium]|nr:Rieske 2Fe-2S domain-containing protein [Gemmatimonadaceae bacterium]
MTSAGHAHHDDASEGTVAASDDLLIEAEALIATLNAHTDPSVGIATSALLERIDTVHRTALAHLMGAIQSMAGDAFVNRLTGDPAIRLLLMSYDLLAVDRRTLAEEALDDVRGHLHLYGVDVELIEVLGGVITVPIHGVTPADTTYAGVVRDLEEALTAGLLGFQELEIRDGKDARAVAADSTFLPAASLKRAFRPVYRDVCRLDALAPGTTRGVVVDDVMVLLVRVDDEVFAVRNCCGDGPLPLDYSTLEGTELRCSWHGCRYDVRTGHRLDRPDASREEYLSVLPVRVSDGVIQVVVGTASVAAAGAPR